MSEAKRKRREPKEDAGCGSGEAGDTAAERVVRRRRVAELTAENEAVRAEVERLQAAAA